MKRSQTVLFILLGGFVGGYEMWTRFYPLMFDEYYGWGSNTEKGITIAFFVTFLLLAVFAGALIGYGIAYILGLLFDQTPTVNTYHLTSFHKEKKRGTRTMMVGKVPIQRSYTYHVYEYEYQDQTGAVQTGSVNTESASVSSGDVSTPHMVVTSYHFENPFADFLAVPKGEAYHFILPK